MLYELFGWLADNHLRGFAVFEYITLRAMLACATALVIGLIAGPFVIRRLTALKIGQAVRSYGPESHLIKTGTPTMGGALILIAIGINARCCGPISPTGLSGQFCWWRLVLAGLAGSTTTARWCAATRRECPRGKSSSGRR